MFKYISDQVWKTANNLTRELTVQLGLNDISEAANSEGGLEPRKLDMLEEFMVLSHQGLRVNVILSVAFRTPGQDVAKHVLPASSAEEECLQIHTLLERQLSPLGDGSIFSLEIVLTEKADCQTRHT